MIKPIIFIIFLLGSSLAFAETRLRLQFREIARISAILNQCEGNNIDLDRLKIDDFARKQGLIFAKKEKLTKEDIGKIVAQILFELDNLYDDKIPNEVCDNNFELYKEYKKALK